MSSMSSPRPTLAARWATASQPASAARTRARSVTSSARVDRAVEDDRLVARRLEPAPHDARPDEPGAAGEQDPHARAVDGRRAPARSRRARARPASAPRPPRSQASRDPEPGRGGHDLERVEAEHGPGEPAAGTARADEPDGGHLQPVTGRGDVDEHGAAGHEQLAAQPEQPDGVAADARRCRPRAGCAASGGAAAQGEDVAVQRGRPARAGHRDGRRRDVDARAPAHRAPTGPRPSGPVRSRRRGSSRSSGRAGAGRRARRRRTSCGTGRSQTSPSRVWSWPPPSAKPGLEVRLRLRHEATPYGRRGRRRARRSGSRGQRRATATHVVAARPRPTAPAPPRPAARPPPAPRRVSRPVSGGRHRHVGDETRVGGPRRAEQPPAAVLGEPEHRVGTVRARSPGRPTVGQHRSGSACGVSMPICTVAPTSPAASPVGVARCARRDPCPCCAARPGSRRARRAARAGAAARSRSPLRAQTRRPRAGPWRRPARRRPRTASRLSSSAAAARAAASCGGVDAWSDGS